MNKESVKEAKFWLDELKGGCFNENWRRVRAVKWEKIDHFNTLAELCLAGKIGKLATKDEIEKIIENIFCSDDITECCRAGVRIDNDRMELYCKKCNKLFPKCVDKRKLLAEALVSKVVKNEQKRD